MNWFKKAWDWIMKQVEDGIDRDFGIDPRTMDDRYGDGSEHLVCNSCGMCRTCGDCECKEEEE